MQLILEIIDVLTDALIVCGFIMAAALIVLWIRQVIDAWPPEP